MNINFSGHAITQALDRDLLVELRAGIKLIRNSEVDSSIRGEVNFIVERKNMIMRREGSSGDLVIVGIDMGSMKVKSVFLQHADQVGYRQENGRRYISLIDLEV